MNANIGKLNSGKCYVYLSGYGVNAEPFYGTEAECEAAILANGVRDPIPVFENGVDMTTSTKPAAPVAMAAAPAPAAVKKRRQARTYIVTFTVVGECYVTTNRECSDEVLAVDRNEAVRKAREIWRHAQGPWGLKCKINARLKGL